MATSNIRRALKQILEPRLAAEGFAGKHPHYRRREGAHLHLLSVVYDKWGGGFVLEFAQHSPGALHTSWGDVVPEENLEIGHANISDRARLVQSTRGQGMYEDFFRYDSITGDAEACIKLVTEAVSLFPQVNDWLRSKQAGSNISQMA